MLKNVKVLEVPTKDFLHIFLVVKGIIVVQSIQQKAPRRRPEELCWADIGPFQIHYSYNSKIVLAFHYQICETEVVADEFCWAIPVVLFHELRNQGFQYAERSIAVLCAIEPRGCVWLPE
ncbi:hypothetical protein GJ744_003087 [Endocarpon pusillum]|uniref:Uncharacterized protein n=1 Tax=Endocarpon pusillum TaxID=364733 RepID=A0A8H7E637_9EURO|nr:hypothetical protein GJ744_003087 [Endocarpon pusillum]